MCKRQIDGLAEEIASLNIIMWLWKIFKIWKSNYEVKGQNKWKVGNRFTEQRILTYCKYEMEEPEKYTVWGEKWDME